MTEHEAERSSRPTPLEKNIEKRKTEVPAITNTQKDHVDKIMEEVDEMITETFKYGAPQGYVKITRHNYIKPKTKEEYTVAIQQENLKQKLEVDKQTSVLSAIERAQKATEAQQKKEEQKANGTITISNKEASGILDALREANEKLEKWELFWTGVKDDYEPYSSTEKDVHEWDFVEDYYEKPK